MLYGIDISEWNGKNVPVSKYDFIILRAAIGNYDGSGCQMDELFSYNYNKCRNAGKPVGVYLYSYARNKKEALQEAEYMVDLLKGKQIDVGVWFDFEDADNWKQTHDFSWTVANCSDICKTFCDRMEKAGYYAGIYASLWMLDNYIEDYSHDKWVAAWGMNTGQPDYLVTNYGTMQQYTSIESGCYDGDVCFLESLDAYRSDPVDKPEPVADAVTELGTMIHKIALDVIAGKYGDGAERMQKLGIYYDMIQSVVNSILLKEGN